MHVASPTAYTEPNSIILRGKDLIRIGVETKYKKYLHLRYDIFSKFDEVHLLPESLYETKPEICALDITAQIEGERVVDLFSGVGGLSIAAARLGKSVKSFDKSDLKIAALVENAKLYEVSTKIIAQKSIVDVNSLNGMVFGSQSIICDPPWQGNGKSDYLSRGNFGISAFGDSAQIVINLIKDHQDKQVLLLVPKNFSISELNEFERQHTHQFHESPGREPFICIKFERIGNYTKLTEDSN